MWPLASVAAASHEAQCIFGILSATANSTAGTMFCSFVQALKEHDIRVMTMFPSVVDTALAR